MQIRKLFTYVFSPFIHFRFSVSEDQIEVFVDDSKILPEKVISLEEQIVFLRRIIEQKNEELEKCYAK